MWKFENVKIWKWNACFGVARKIAPSGSDASERGAMEIKNESKAARKIAPSGSDASERGAIEIQVW